MKNPGKVRARTNGTKSPRRSEALRFIFSFGLTSVLLMTLSVPLEPPPKENLHISAHYLVILVKYIQFNSIQITARKRITFARKTTQETVDHYSTKGTRAQKNDGSHGASQPKDRRSEDYADGAHAQVRIVSTVTVFCSPVPPTKQTASTGWSDELLGRQVRTRFTVGNL